MLIGARSALKAVKWKQAVMVALTATAVFGAVYGMAASLGADGADLAAGSDEIEACDSSVSFDFSLNSSGQITAVTVGELDAACGGGLLSLTLADSNNSAVSSGSAQVPASGGSVSVAVSPSVSPSLVYHEHVSIVGP